MKKSIIGFIKYLIPVNIFSILLLFSYSIVHTLLRNRNRIFVEPLIYLVVLGIISITISLMVYFLFQLLKNYYILKVSFLIFIFSISLYLLINGLLTLRPFNSDFEDWAFIVGSYWLMSGICGISTAIIIFLQYFKRNDKV